MTKETYEQSLRARGTDSLIKAGDTDGAKIAMMAAISVSLERIANVAECLVNGIYAEIMKGKL